MKDISKRGISVLSELDDEIDATIPWKSSSQKEAIKPSATSVEALHGMSEIGGADIRSGSGEVKAHHFHWFIGNRVPPQLLAS